MRLSLTMCRLSTQSLQDNQCNKINWAIYVTFVRHICSKYIYIAYALPFAYIWSLLLLMRINYIYYIYYIIKCVLWISNANFLDSQISVFNCIEHRFDFDTSNVITIKIASEKAFRNWYKRRYFTSSDRGIGNSFQLAITPPL